MRALTVSLHRSVVRPARLAPCSVPTVRRPMSTPPASTPEGAPAVATEAAAAPATAPAAPAEEGPEFLKLDVRVGRIVSIETHPDADG